jgi:hypothetical protein
MLDRTKTKTPTRPPLRRVPLRDWFPPRRGFVTLTMSVGQWDAALAAAYAIGCVLLELDHQERPLAAYYHGGPERN